VTRRALVATTIPLTAHKFYGELIDELRGRGFEVHLVTSDGPEIPRLRQRVDAVHVVEMSRTISLSADARSLVRWVRTLRRVRPQLVLAGTPKAGLLGMIAARLVGVPSRAYLLQGLRLEGTTGATRRVLGLMERIASWCSRRVIAVSPSLARVYQDAGLNAGRPVVVGHHGGSHGVDSAFFTPRPRDAATLTRFGLDPSLPVVLFVGRLTADKGPHTLVAAMRMLRQRGVPVQLLVVGAQDEGDSQRLLDQLRSESDSVRVLDHVDDVRPCYAASDVLVLPTLREGLPNVVLEAGAMGVPSVTTTATGAVDSVVHEQTGLLVPPEDPSALADALGRLLTDTELRDRLGAAARERVVRDFQPADVAAAIVTYALL